MKKDAILKEYFKNSQYFKIIDTEGKKGASQAAAIAEGKPDPS